MNVINIEFYSILILLILILNYIKKFKNKFDVSSLLWLVLTISTIFISIGNIFFALSDNYVIKLISVIIYLFCTFISSLFVYLYVKYTYIDYKKNIKKEFFHILIILFISVLVSLHYIFNSQSIYIIHSFDRLFFNKILVFAIIPNIVVLVLYIINSLKNKILINYKVIITLLITIIGLIIDIKNSTFYFISASFTITSLIMYINKHEKLLNVDPLTGLINKRGLEVYLINLKSKIKIAVYNIDVDKFKIINDTYGHDKGDTVLQTVANILSESSRKSDLVVRNGGDEFLILAEIKKKEDAEKIIERINFALDEYNKSTKIKVSLSIGWDIFHSTDDNTLEKFNEFLKQTDKKMYEEKEKKHKKIKG